MPRVLVVSEHDSSRVMFSEEVKGCHLRDAHSAEQFGERLVWAIHDCEDEDAREAEHAPLAAQGYLTVPGD